MFFMETNKKLFLIDGMSIVFRAYHAMANSGLKSKDGEPTGAVFAFSNIITSLLEKYDPENIAVVFDRAEPTFRHDIYPEYKANRAEFPEDLVPQLPRIKELLDLINIPRFEIAGFEADDIIGTLAKKASGDNWQVVCITSDKDYFQLVDGNISLLKPGKRGEDFESVGIPDVLNKFGVTPDKVIDVLGLIGDSSDNVPGIKGIGEKTAIPLIQQYGSIENIYNNLSLIEKDSLRNKFETSKEIAMLSKYLVTIDTNVPIDFSHYSCNLGVPDYDGLDHLFALLGFNTIRAKWRNKAQNNNQKVENNLNDSNEVTNIDQIEKEYVLVKSINQLKNIISEINNSEYLSIDLETDSLDKNTCEIVGISFSHEIGKAYYVPVEYFIAESVYHSDSLFSQEKPIVKWEESLNIYEVLLLIKPMLENPAIKKVGQNIKFDTFIFKRHDVNIYPIYFDSMVASYLIDPDQKHNMDALAEKYLNYKPISITSLIGEKKSTQKSMRELNPGEISDYACEDADVTLKLMYALKPIIEKENLTKLAFDIEFPLINVLCDMELSGISINEKSLKELSIIIKEELSKLKDLIYKESNEIFNIDSPKQLGEILFDKMMIPGGKKNKTGYSTDLQVLSELSPSYPIAEFVLEYRQLNKLLSTYVESLPKLINPTTGRIHTTYNQTVASTGRLSSTDPNLQNIPIRTDIGKKIRKVFVAKNNDYMIYSADYSQIELRIMAFISNDIHLINAFKNGHDIHSATAAILNNVDLSEVDSDMRRIAKTVNFGIMYGLGAFGLAQRLNLNRTHAKEIITNYFEKYPGIKSYMDMTVKFTRERGYAETLFGRRRYFNDINNNNANLRTAAERGAINMPIQGTASDMMKIAMKKIHDIMISEQMESKMLLQVHDELVFEAHKNELEHLDILVKKCMVEALPLGEVPVVVDAGYGPNWYEAH